MFFNKFPLRWQNFPDESQRLVTNICARLAATTKAKANVTALYEHRIDDGDLPNKLSFRTYGTEDYWWVICLINDIHDIHEDWPLSERQLDEMIADKYPDHEETDILYYKDVNGHKTTPDAMRMVHGLNTNAEAITLFDLTPVSIRQHEDEINEAKKTIKMVHQDHVGIFKIAIEDAFSE